MAFGFTKAFTSIATTIIYFQMTIAELVVKPTDRESLVDELTYFNCSTSVVSQAIQWFHFPLGVSGDREIVYGYNQFYGIYKDRFAIEVNEAAGTYNLVIRSVQVQDAGRYECQDDVGRGAKASARLIVLDNRPICQSNQKTNEVIGPNTCNIPQGEMQLTCSATYHGDDAPILKWFQDGSNQPVTDGASFSSSGNRSQSNLTLTAGSIKNGSSFYCRTTRSIAAQSNCTSGRVKIIGTPTVATCPNTKPCTDALLVTWLFLIPIFIASSVVATMFYLSRRPFNIFSRPVTVKEKDSECYVKGEEATYEEAVHLDSKVTENDEPEVPQEINSKATEDHSEHYEQLRKQIRQLFKKNEQKDKEIVELKKKIKLLENEALELEGWLYPSAVTSYSHKPNEVARIVISNPEANSKKETRPIFGMTVLHNKLYVVTERNCDIEVYDSVTFNHETKLQVDGMSNPMDIASCSRNTCLYICDCKSENDINILRVDSSQTPSKCWPIRENAGHLSVTRVGNVVVSLFNGNKINEYSPDGILIREVRLSPADNINHPWHAIKTTSMHFIFSHGIGNDPLQRVCVASADGKIMKSFGGKKGKDIKEEHMNRPVHLLEDRSRNVLVADMKNGRVFLLSPTLEYKRTLLSSDSKLRFPMRLCLDEERGILFVADNNYKEKECTYDNGRILVFNCKTQKSQI